MKVRTIEQADGSIWAVPVDAIARDRAANYASEFEGDVERSLAEDTLPLFEKHPDEIHDWASNNMNWSDVEGVAFKLRDLALRPNDFQEAWVDGEHDIEDVEAPCQEASAE